MAADQQLHASFTSPGAIQSIGWSTLSLDSGSVETCSVKINLNASAYQDIFENSLLTALWEQLWKTPFFPG